MLAYLLAQGLKQTVIAKPAIGDNQNRDINKDNRKTSQHINGLLELGLKQNRLTVNLNLASLNGFFHMIEAKGHWQESPTPLNLFQQTDRNNILRPRVLGLIDFSRMIEKRCAAEDLFAGFRINVIAQSTAQRRFQGILGDAMKG